MKSYRNGLRQRMLFAGPLSIFCFASGLLPLTRAGQSQSVPAISQQDADGDGLSDYQELHKYFTDPHKNHTASDAKPDGDWNQRREFTYTITSVMRILKPVNPADMNDDYQDARILSEDKDSYTVEIVYYPLNTNREAIGENSNWKKDYAAMTEYLRPTPTENWDVQMQRDLISELHRDGIDPDKLTDRQLVQQVSQWAIRRSATTNAFAVWTVYFPEGKPRVYPALLDAFNQQKPSKDWTDQAMFDRELLGKQMYYNKVHGSCTSTSIYLTTIFRALGIPTRTIFCIPPADVNDRAQTQMLLNGIHHNQVRATIANGLVVNGFVNHLFNEVYVGRHWVRLNYDNLGQNILDQNYLGLMTHIYTATDLSKVPLAQTWGMRFFDYDHASPRLSSVNPYQLLSVSDHFGKYSHILNPEVPIQDLKAVHITGLFWKGDPDLPEWIRQGLAQDDRTDFVIRISEFVPDNRHQMRDFEQRAGHQFTLRARGHADVTCRLSGNKMNDGDGQWVLFGVRLDPKADNVLASGTDYTLLPFNTNDTYRWIASDTVHLRKP